MGSTHRPSGGDIARQKRHTRKHACGENQRSRIVPGEAIEQMLNEARELDCAQSPCRYS